MQDHSTHELITAMVACIRLVQDQATQNVNMDGGGAHEGLPLAEDLLASTDWSWTRDVWAGGNF